MESGDLDSAASTLEQMRKKYRSARFSANEVPAMFRLSDVEFRRWKYGRAAELLYEAASLTRNDEASSPGRMLARVIRLLFDLAEAVHAADTSAVVYVAGIRCSRSHARCTYAKAPALKRSSQIRDRLSKSFINPTIDTPRSADRDDFVCAFEAVPRSRRKAAVDPRPSACESRPSQSSNSGIAAESQVCALPASSKRRRMNSRRSASSEKYMRCFVETWTM